MEEPKRPSRSLLVTLAAALVIVLLLSAFSFIATSAELSSANTHISSLSMGLSSDNSLVLAESSTVSCLQQQVTSLENRTASSGTGTAVESSSSTTSSDECVSTVNDQNDLSFINVTMSLTVPSGQGQGLLAVTVWNGASVPITGISVDISKSGLAAVAGLPTFSYDGAQVSAVNPLPNSATTSGNATLESGSVGLYSVDGYDFGISVTFQNGAPQAESVYVMAGI